MEFSVSGVHVSPFVPVMAGFFVASLTTPAGVSGAFLLLPFQFTILGFTAPGVTPTNLLYNVFSTPGSVLRYRAQGDLEWGLVGRIVLGAVPGIVAGSLLRITVFEDPAKFKVLVGSVLLALGLNLVVQAAMKHRHRPPATDDPRSFLIFGLGAVAGLIGGIYGISGGSMIAPALVGIFGLSVRRVAPAALIATFLTSAAGVASFEILDLLAAGGGSAARPDWPLALLFGVGGAAGGNVGARLNNRGAEGGLRILLGALAILLGVSYVRTTL